MSIFGSMFTATSGLAAQSQSMGMISNNIANVSTVGYKRTDASFASLVTSEGNSTLYTPGAVKAIQNQRVSLQGILQQSSSATDLAISGNGFFAVRNSTTNPNAETVFTRAGSFAMDELGELRNSSGFSLYGWPLDANGALPATTDLSTLVPVDVGFDQGLFVPTTTASLDMNLNANQAVTGADNFVRTIDMYDSNGNRQPLQVRFERTPPSAGSTAGTLDLTSSTGVLPAGSFDVDGGGGAVTITMDGTTTTLNDVMTQLNAVANVNARIQDGLMIIESDTVGNNLTLTDTTPGTLAQFGLVANVYGPYAPNPLTGYTMGLQPENPSGWWQITFTGPNGDLLSGDVNFDTNGNLNATLVAGEANINLGPTDWGDTSNTPQTVAFDLSGIRMLGSSYTVSNAVQNGTELGYRTGVSVDDAGVVSVQFTNGLSREVYQLGIATFANPDGLTALNGNVFRISDTSGIAQMSVAQTNGAGTVEGGALEQSNVDLADEFSKMIVTQRAYSANTKVITTADQMTAELLQLR